jgi:hypothetical protein
MKYTYIRLGYYNDQIIFFKEPFKIYSTSICFILLNTYFTKVHTCKTKIAKNCLYFETPNSNFQPILQRNISKLMYNSEELICL